MAYTSKHGITEIAKNRGYRLSLSLDYFDKPEDKIPVILFTPDKQNSDNHFHIELSRDEVKELKKWIDEYCLEYKIF